MGSFESLRYRNFRLLWTGAVLSNIGTWMQTVALSWHVLVLTRSAFWVSFVTFAYIIPTIASPIAGVYTDRMDRKRILLYAQAFMMVNAALLAALAWIGQAKLAAVLVLTFGQGLGFAVNAPAWIAFLPSLVPPSAMVNAIALNSVQFNLARVIGPAIAGALIVVSGPALVFTLNAASFVTVLIALGLIRTEWAGRRDHRTVRELLVNGFEYAWRHRPIRQLIAAIAVLSLFGAPATVLLPVFASEVFERGAGGYGALAAALGFGSVLGALALGRLGNRVTGNVIAAAMISVSLVLVLFASIEVYAAGILLIALFGASFLMVVAGTNSGIMLRVDERIRGRVISIWMLAFGVAFPIGSLLAGAAAEAWGAQPATVVGGAACGVWGAGMLWRSRGPAARPALEPAA